MAWERLRLQKHETLTVGFVWGWVYFAHEKFESGFARSNFVCHNFTPFDAFVWLCLSLCFLFVAGLL
jgi:hypothetical protein